MLFYYIRHGDPVYDPDSLTPLGQKQAEALAKRLSMFGLDEIYASTSMRARQTAQPTCDLLKKEMQLLDFCNEKYAFEQMSLTDENGRRRWLFGDSEVRRLFASPEILNMGMKWYEHPAFAKYDFKSGVMRAYDGLDEFFASLGYEHIRYSGSYREVCPNEKRVALFAHQGFGMLFFSCLLDIPYPVFCNHFELGHSSMTVIHFDSMGEGIAIPRIWTYSSDSHLYKEGLPLDYNHWCRI